MPSYNNWKKDKNARVLEREKYREAAAIWHLDQSIDQTKSRIQNDNESLETAVERGDASAQQVAAERLVMDEQRLDTLQSDRNMHQDLLMTWEDALIQNEHLGGDSFKGKKKAFKIAIGLAGANNNKQAMYQLQRSQETYFKARSSEGPIRKMTAAKNVSKQAHMKIQMAARRVAEKKARAAAARDEIKAEMGALEGSATTG